MYEWYQKNKYFCILILVVLLGAVIDVAAHLQPSYQAEVVSVSNLTYTPARRSGRSRSSARYGATLTVTFTDERGVVQTGTFRIKTANQRRIPKEGETFAVVKGLLGITEYPDPVLRGVGIAMYGPPGVILFLVLLTKFVMWRKGESGEAQD